MKIQSGIYLVVFTCFLSGSLAYAAKPKVKLAEKPKSVVIYPAGEWSNPLFQKEEGLTWLKAAANPTWKRDRLGMLRFDERIEGGGTHFDLIEFKEQTSSIYGQDLLNGLTQNQRDDWGRKQDSFLDQIGSLKITDAEKRDILGKRSKDDLAILLFKRILQHEAVKARFQVPLTEQRIQYATRRFLVDVGRQLAPAHLEVFFERCLSEKTKNDYLEDKEFLQKKITKSLLTFSNEQLFGRVLKMIELRSQADVAASAKKIRLGVGYGLDWSVKVEGLESELNLMLDADDEVKNAQKKLGEKHERNWVEWTPIRIEFKEFPAHYDDFARNFRTQVQKKQAEQLLTTPVLKNIWLRLLRKNIQLPLRGETLGIWPQSKEVLRIFNETQRKLDVLSWSLEGPKNAEFAELIQKRLAEKGDAWVQEQLVKKFSAQAEPEKKSEKPVESAHEAAPSESITTVFKRILDDLMTESSEWVKKGQLTITPSHQTIEFNEFDVAETKDALLKQLVSRDEGGMRLFPVASVMSEPVPVYKLPLAEPQGFNYKTISLSFRLSLDQGTPVVKTDKISGEAWGIIASGIREKALQFEMKRILYKLFQANPFEWAHEVCEQPEWPCLSASPQALAETLMPDVLSPEWEKETGVKSTLDLIDLGDEMLLQRSLEKVQGFDSRKLNTVLQPN